MDAAIGRLHLSITVAQPAAPLEVVEPVEDGTRLERALRRDLAERAAESDRMNWNASYHSRGHFS